jgi:hypothetical protein
MKNIIIIIALTIFSGYFLPSFANGKDIEYKKNNSLEWYKNNIEAENQVYYSVANDLDIQKQKSLRWHSSNIEKKEFNFPDLIKETTSLREKALRWYSANSQ